MRYAIGEIILVVVGILIALQINNWNEERKSGFIELKLLEELYFTIEGDLQLNAKNIERNMASIQSAQLLLDHFENSKPYHDSLNPHFANAIKRYISLTRDNAYQNIKSHGLEFISNDTTKGELSWMYETNIEWLKRLDERATLYENTFMMPEVAKLFETVSLHIDYDYVDIMSPINYDSLKRNKEFIGILKSTKNYKEDYIVFHKRLYDRMENLLVLIGREIELKKR